MPQSARAREALDEGVGGLEGAFDPSPVTREDLATEVDWEGCVWLRCPAMISSELTPARQKCQASSRGSAPHCWKAEPIGEGTAAPGCAAWSHSVTASRSSADAGAPSLRPPARATIGSLFRVSALLAVSLLVALADPGAHRRRRSVRLRRLVEAQHLPGHGGACVAQLDCDCHRRAVSDQPPLGHVAWFASGQVASRKARIVAATSGDSAMLYPGPPCSRIIGRPEPSLS